MAECDQGRAHRKAVHLLICRIDVIRGKEKTEFNIERMLNSILGQMVAGVRNLFYQLYYSSFG